MDINCVKSFAKTRLESTKTILDEIHPVNRDPNRVSEYKGMVKAYEEILEFILNFEAFEKELKDDVKKA